MKYAPLIAVLLGFLLPPGVRALEAEPDSAQPAAPGQTAPALTSVLLPAPALDPATAAYGQAFTALMRERQAFITSINGRQARDNVAVTREYARGMKDFARRELELRRDWLRATGQAGRLARVEAQLARLLNPPRGLPQIAGGQHPAATSEAQPCSPEVTR
jgi:hypothetical protein